MDSCSGRVSDWNWFSAFAGHGDTSPALSGIGAGRASGITSKNNNVDACSDAAQYSGRMAVGVTFAGVLSDNVLITMTGAFVLSAGIAIQNFPEGAIISMPLRRRELQN